MKLKTPCLVSALRKDKDGYPRVKHQHRQMPAARLVMMLVHGEAKVRGKLVCHHCDNPGCVNTEHLYLGDFTQNMADKAVRRRVAGSNHPKSKLTEQQCDDIRRIYKETDISQEALGRMYGMGQSQISFIVLNKRKRSKPRSR